MSRSINLSDTIGLAKTGVDVHTLGVSTIGDLLQELGFRTVYSSGRVSKALSHPSDSANAALIDRWIRESGITVLGFSYRLDPDDAVRAFGQLLYQLKEKGLFDGIGCGQIKSVSFAGLPPACERIKREYGDRANVFYGDESFAESLEILGIDSSLLPPELVKKHDYDVHLERFGKEVVDDGRYFSIDPLCRDYANFGTRQDSLVARIMHGRQRGLHPLMRVHAGPYGQDRKEAVKLFLNWSKRLSDGGLLDILSLGTSQLTQERFGEDWSGRPNGGGLPVNSPEEYASIWEASRPMLVRTYAGTKNIVELAGMYEDTINIAWHALSLWWFSQLDGRGPNSVLDNLEEHFETIRYVASTGKPFEPNVPHHFAFRGADDISYVVSAVLSARIAKDLGIRHFVLQEMLNVPKHTFGVHDLAKARATLQLVRELEDAQFSVYLQTRAGLDYLSHDTEKAKAQLASVTALMDDIEPNNLQSPDIIHVVSYSEGSHLATPDVIHESIQLTRYALDKYRDLRRHDQIRDMSSHSDVTSRMRYLVEGARLVLSTIEDCIDHPYTPEGFYDILKAGFFPLPQLMGCRDEFENAVMWQTKVRNGCVDVYMGGKLLAPSARMNMIKEAIEG